MHLVITDPVHQWQGDNDDIISHGRLYDVFTVELAQVYTCKYIDSMRLTILLALLTTYHTCCRSMLPWP